jgi:thymidylate synthase (FAD)
MNNTKRPISPGAEEVLDLYFPVLDGTSFISLIDYMGNDESIEQAARVSYGAGTRKVSQTRGLLRYLQRHYHSTPREMIELKFHVCCPILVMRQWIRTRTACLSGDTLLYFDEPAAIKNNTRKIRRISIKDFYNNWTNGFMQTGGLRKDGYIENLKDDKEYSVSELSKLVYRNPESIRNLIYQNKLNCNKSIPKSPTDPVYKITKQQWFNYVIDRPIYYLDGKNVLKNMNLRSCDETTGEIIHTKINDIWSNGFKQVFQVTLENGYSIKMTQDHLCLTNNGWKTLFEATQLKLGQNNTVSWNGNCPEFAVNGIPVYQDKNWLLERRQKGYDIQTIANEAECSYHTIRKWLKIHNLKFTSAEKSKLSGFKQRGQKRTIINKRKPLSEEALKNVRAARSGEKSNFWKGGISSDRENIGRWTTEQSAKVFKKYNYKCVICESSNKLNAHHIDPVWNNSDLAKDFNNLICLCKKCHQTIHGKNLELIFLEYVNKQLNLSDFFIKNNIVMPFPKEKGNKTSQKLIRTYSKIKSIKYIGEEEVFDIEVSGPDHNFVANGFIVHNSVNEYSGRYSLMPMIFYTPPIEQFAHQSKNNNQGRGKQTDPQLYKAAIERWDALRKESAQFYEDLTAADVARELARIDLPLSTLTQFYWKIDLHNLLKFLTLRVDSHAQWEIREFANILAGIVKKVCPLSFEAWIDYEFAGSHFSRMELDLLKKLITPGQDQQGKTYISTHSAQIIKEENMTELSSREIKELVQKFQPKDIPNFELDLTKAKEASYFEELMAAAVPKIDKK